uniref:TF-B3 domain-containing protein n=1 Tax=Arundo donax TaxID=35708 RepID=A0A0A9D690_ARUDO
MQNLGKNCKVCMEWQEHCYWSHMPDEKKHFFKLVTGDFTESMSIPVKFADNFNGHISEVVSMKSPSGKTWSIGVGTDTDQVVLRSGWKEFVAAHSIEDGDYLLFKYTGVSSFDVLIFDSSGCEKTSPHFVNSHGYERIESSAGVEGARHGCHRFNRGEDCTPQLLRSDDDDDNDAHRELALHKNSSKRIRKPCKRNLHQVIEQTHCVVKDDEDDLELDEGDTPAKTGYYFCKNGPVMEYHLTEEEREEISSIRVPVQSRNPVFVQVMHPSHVRGKKSGVVGISSEFATKYMRTVHREVILERASSKGKWHVRYNCNKFSRGLCGRGWCGFVNDNGLVDHDVCLFELIKGARRLTMTVHVLRKVRGRFVLLR